MIHLTRESLLTLPCNTSFVQQLFSTLQSGSTLHFRLEYTQRPSQIKWLGFG